THSFSQSSIFPPSPPSEPAPIHAKILENEYSGLPPVPKSEEPTKVLPVDINSADSHVPRDERMVRLTGNHPYNVEAPLPVLMEKGLSISSIFIGYCLTWL